SEFWNSGHAGGVIVSRRMAMSSTRQRLELCQTVLALIEAKRKQTGDESLGSRIERAILEGELRDLEQEILDNPGPFETWLIRRRVAKS
ncbi:MAG: hypothetical protein M1482_00755, partial [Chloroflexi bacterium]|nr:hypothetical protein [Chloroflexota bacterium]